MNQDAKSADRLKAVLVLLATIGTIAFNGLAVAGYVNGVTPGAVSAKYPTVVTPAGYAFTIWSLIYFGMITFSIYQLLPSKIERFRNIRSLYILSCVMNCGWIFFWQQEMIGVCLALILALLGTLLFINVRLNMVETAREALFTKAPFGIYFGWVTAASIVVCFIVLKNVRPDLSTAAWTTLGVVFIVFATALSVIVRIKLKNYFYPLAIAWALTAIAINQGGHTAIVVAAAFGVVICLVTSGSFVVDLKDSTSE